MANRNKKQKLDTSATAPQPLGGGNPFGQLDAVPDLDLPAGPPEETPAPVKDPSLPRETVLRRERPPQGGKVAVVAGQFRPTPPRAALLETWKSELAKAAACSVKVRDQEIWVLADRPAVVAEFFQKKNVKVRGVTQ